MISLLRSILFVPGSSPERFTKADNAGADLVCIDLEDAVLPEDKDEARQAAVDYITEHNRQLCVRINAVDSVLGQLDLAAMAVAKPKYLMLAKCSQASQVEKAVNACAAETKIIALIENIEGIEQAHKIAVADNVVALMFGGADVAAQLRCDFSFQPLLFARSQLVMAAAKANIELVDVPFVDIHNDTALAEEAGQVRQLGFTGKAAIHPRQVDIIHQAFMPNAQQLAFAQAVVAAVDNPDAGVVVVDGHMVDRPIILAAQRILASVSTRNFADK